MAVVLSAAQILEEPTAEETALHDQIQPTVVHPPHQPPSEPAGELLKTRSVVAAELRPSPGVGWGGVGCPSPSACLRASSIGRQCPAPPPRLLPQPGSLSVLQDLLAFMVSAPLSGGLLPTPPPASLRTLTSFHLQKLHQIGILVRFPFSSSLQRMSVVARTLGEKRLVAYAKGAPETVVGLCRKETGELPGGGGGAGEQPCFCRDWN